MGGPYQAVIPPVSEVKQKPASRDIPDHAVLVWSPYNNLNEKDLENYLEIAKEKYNYNMEQALGMLCWHKFDISHASADLPNFTPFPDEWSVEDKVLFEQAFQFHDKHFHKIRQMLPDKSIASLVKYYYSWKKTRCRTSLMDRQARRLKEDAKDDVSDDGASDDAASTESMDIDKPGKSGQLDIPDPRVDGKPRCENCCTTATGKFHDTYKGVLCNACYSYWRRTGTMKSTSPKKSTSNDNSKPTLSGQKQRKPPRGMYVDTDDLQACATGSEREGDVILKNLDQEIVSIKRQVQNNKQIISQLKQKIAQEINEEPKEKQLSQPRNSRWTKDEELLAVQALRKYGKDFQAVAEIIGNKTESNIKSFYASNERRYQLNKIIEQFNQDNLEESEENNDPVTAGHSVPRKSRAVSSE